MADTTLPVYLALQKAVRDAIAPIPLAVENVEFDPPESGLHVRCQIAPVGVEDPVFGSRYRRELYQLQLFVVGQVNTGINATMSKAGELRELFKRGYENNIDNMKIRVFSTPSMGGNIPTDNEVVTPLIVPVTVEVYD